MELIHLVNNFLVRSYLPWIRKDSVTCIKESSDNSWLDLLPFGVFFLLLCWTPSSLCMLLDAISSKRDEGLIINLSANIFVFGEFNIHHEDWLTYSSGSHRPNWTLSYSFYLKQPYSDDLHSYLDPWLILTALLFWIYLFLLTIVFVLQ